MYNAIFEHVYFLLRIHETYSNGVLEMLNQLSKEVCLFYFL